MAVMVYLPLGRPNFLSAARFHGLKSFFSSGLNWDAFRVDCSRSEVASPACDDAHRIDPAVYVWRANGESGRLRAGLVNPRRLAMVDVGSRTRAGGTCAVDGGRGTSAKSARRFKIQGNFLGPGHRPALRVRVIYGHVCPCPCPLWLFVFRVSDKRNITKRSRHPSSTPKHHVFVPSTFRTPPNQLNLTT